MNTALTFLILALLATACDDSRPPPEIPPGVLQVDFESVDYPSALDYVTDLAFLPDASGEFLAIDLYGKLEHARLGDGGATPLMSGSFDDIYVLFERANH